MKKFLYYFILLVFFVIFTEVFLGIFGLYELFKRYNIDPVYTTMPRSISQAKTLISKYYSSFIRVYKTKPIIRVYNLKNYKCDGKNNCNEKLRLPDGLKYLNSSKSPIVIFGCSFAHGDKNLTQNQTFSHKLSEALHRTVYNRGIQGQGIAQMYYQSLNDDFYNAVSPSDTVIYVLIKDHYRRMLLYKLDPTDTNMIIKYNKKNNNLYIDEYSPIKNFLRMTYTASFLRHYFVHKYVNNHKNADKLTDFMVLHFIKTREELEKHWNNKVNFIVIMYGYVDYHHLLKDKLIKNGFNVILTDDLTNEDLSSSKYKFPDGHPTEEAWNLLTPLIIEKANL